MDTVLLVAFLVTAVGWSFVTLLGILGHLSLDDLPRLPERDVGHDTAAGDVATAGPEVSVIIPTRDEGERLERTVHALLAQRHIDLEVIVVDDRSSDSTQDMLTELAKTDPRLHVIRVDEIPDGWLGKCHACHLGSLRAASDWLLFIDADAWCRDDVVARSLAAARAGAADHLCLVPGLGTCTLAGKAVVLMITLGLLGIAWGLSRNLPFGYVGVGGFTLIRRRAYDAVGGHERVRLEVVEDFAIGYLVKKAGLRTRLLAAIHDVEVRWVHSATSFVQVLEKNLFAKMNFRLWRAIINVVAVLAIWALPILGAVLATPAGIAAAVAMGAATIPTMWMARRHGWSILSGLAAPLSLPLLAFAMAHSTWCVVRQGGIRWRETFYSLSDLRAAAARID